MEFVNRKRDRDESSESRFDSPPDVKRLRDDLLDILADSDSDPTIQDLASVMKSFEEEITGSSPSLPVPVVDLTSDSDMSQLELGYLFEASDDELGLPPSIITSLSEESKIEEEPEFVQVSTESVGLGDLWGFEDGIPSYDSLELFGGDNFNHINNNEYVALDGLFDYSDDMGSGSSDILWRLETMPAL